MVAEAWEENHERDPRKGTVADRFRLLGATGGDTGDDHAPAGAAAPPVFGTAPWGYKRAEVDAWTSWVAGLVAHGRRETVRADSAEATLRATLERLEALHQRAAPTDENQADGTRTGESQTSGNRAGENQAGENGASGDGTSRDGADGNRADGNRGTGDRGTGEPTDDDPPVTEHAAAGKTARDREPDHPNDPGTTARDRRPEHSIDPGGAERHREPDHPTDPDDGAPDREPEDPEPDRQYHRREPEQPTALPRRTGRPTAVPDPAETPARDAETARLHVVETTLHEVMTLLHRLAGPPGS